MTPTDTQFLANVSNKTLFGGFTYVNPKFVPPKEQLQVPIAIPVNVVVGIVLPAALHCLVDVSVHLTVGAVFAFFL